METPSSVKHMNGNLPAVAVHSGQTSERDDFLLKHTPQILAALIARRYSTTPDELVSLAISTTAELYEQLSQT